MVCANSGVMKYFECVDVRHKRITGWDRCPYTVELMVSVSLQGEGNSESPEDVGDNVN